MQVSKNHSVLLIAVLIFALAAATIYNVPMYLSFFFVTLFTFFYLLKAGYPKDGLAKNALMGIKQIIPIILILGAIGMMISLWMKTGTLATCVIYGLKILPNFNIVLAAFLLTTIISMLLGTAVGTIGTIGIMLIALANTLNVPLPLMVGAIISGSYFGDRTSPMSSSANLVAEVSEINIRTQIRFLLATSAIPYVLSILYYYYVGKNYMPSVKTLAIIEQQITLLNDHFNPNLIHIIPVIILIGVIVLLRKGILTAIICAIISSVIIGLISNMAIDNMMITAILGYEPSNKAISEIFKGSGLISMVPVFLVLSFASLLNTLYDHIKLFDTLFSNFDKLLTSKLRLIFGSGAISLFVMLITGNQSLPIIVTGNRYGEKYEQMQIDKRWLSQTISDYTIILVAMFPWNINAILVKSMLSVSSTQYVPYAILPFLLPLGAIFFTYVKRDTI